MLGNETGGCLRGLCRGAFDRLLHNLLLDVYTLQYISLFTRKEGPSCNVIPATAQGTAIRQGMGWEDPCKVVRDVPCLPSLSTRRGGTDRDSELAHNFNVR